MKKNRVLFDFAVRMIAFRKAHPVLHSEKPVRLMDYLGCGYPDVSFHGSRPWQMEEMPAGRYLGVLYGGPYVRKDGQDDSFLYFAYNMHWEPKLIGLPALPQNMEWQPVICTSEVHEPGTAALTVRMADCEKDMAATSAVNTGTRKENIVIEPRTIVVFEGTAGAGHHADR